MIKKNFPFPLRKGKKRGGASKEQKPCRIGGCICKRQDALKEDLSRERSVGHQGKFSHV